VASPRRDDDPMLLCLHIYANVNMFLRPLGATTTLCYFVYVFMLTSYVFTTYIFTIWLSFHLLSVYDISNQILRKHLMILRIISLHNLVYIRFLLFTSYIHDIYDTHLCSETKIHKKNRSKYKVICHNPLINGIRCCHKKLNSLINPPY
jgi:hypothetical protein